ncbi:hypothetical protein OG196_32585 [Kitasatospora purpeofusca]|nr:hypothetical protein [Kitasatospora purpeofusca]MCX4757147.1 hypothetical protein [Kitasatospora purpeofusca]WSR35092.1 hypothetical protein OG715_31540 [Kitasatospora purpeofusca]WSR43415.1 hypothetical protein OG196_32585 [Kitasatospora purpeofusca]
MDQQAADRFGAKGWVGGVGHRCQAGGLGGGCAGGIRRGEGPVDVDAGGGEADDVVLVPLGVGVVDEEVAAFEDDVRLDGGGLAHRHGGTAEGREFPGRREGAVALEVGVVGNVGEVGVGPDGEDVPGLCGVFDAGGVAQVEVRGAAVGGSHLVGQAVADVADRDDDQPGGGRVGGAVQFDSVVADGDGRAGRERVDVADQRVAVPSVPFSGRTECLVTAIENTRARGCSTDPVSATATASAVTSPKVRGVPGVFAGRSMTASMPWVRRTGSLVVSAASRSP